jgi:acetyl esterase/lipase
MNIDPELREMAELMKGRQLPGGEVDIAAARQGLLAMVGQPEADHRVEVSERTVEGPPGAPDVRVVTFCARGHDEPCAGVIYLHGGGFMVGAPETEWGVAVAAALAVNGIVVSVDYRLAPENPYPAAVEDSYAALTWMARHSEDLGIDPRRIAVAGISAGGTLASALTLMARDRGGPNIAYQHLIIPAFDDRLETPSMRTFTETPMWSRGLAEISWRRYLGDRKDVPAYAAPARATDFHGLPPAYIAVSEFDPLRDEGIDYARSLLNAGVTVELHVFPGTFHGSTIVADAAISKRQTEEAAVVLRRALRLALVGDDASRNDAPDQPEASAEHQRSAERCG